MVYLERKFLTAEGSLDYRRYAMLRPFTENMANFRILSWNREDFKTRVYSFFRQWNKYFNTHIESGTYSALFTLHVFSTFTHRDL